MKGGYQTFFEMLEEENEGLPSIQEFPQVQHPGVELPPLTEDVSKLPDDVLATNIRIYSSYNAAGHVAIGMYAAYEEHCKYELNHERRSVYMEKHHNGDFKGHLKDHKNYLVDNDERVLELDDKYQAIRGSHIMFKSRVESYEKMLMLYMSERKHRREYAVNGRSPNGESLG